MNALVGQTELLAALKRPVVITPHPGEFARLSGMDVAEVQSDRISHAAAFAGRSESLVVVLKGAGTVVTDGRRYFINSTGNPGMATGGTGDVLTGVIAALLAQKLPAFEAAQLGVFIHGLAGDIARDQNGEIGLIAGDLVDALPDAFVHAMPDPDQFQASMDDDRPCDYRRPDQRSLRRSPASHKLGINGLSRETVSGVE